MNTATAVYIDVTDFNGTGQTATLDSLDSSTNTNKAQFRFTKKGDVTKWLIFTMQSRTTHTGYREYALTNVSSSTASPFSNNDELLLTVSIAGDAGGGATGTQIQNQAFTYFADSGSANAYAGTISPTPSYTNGLSVLMKVANANTGASTLNLNSLGTKNIYKDQAGTLVPLTGGELSAGQMVPLSYDGTQFQITGGGGGDVTAKYVLGDFDTQLTNSAKNSTVYLGPDVCPASPNTLNDEFDDTTGNSGTINGLNARWSWMNQGSSTATFKGSKLVLYGPAASSQHQVRGIYVALPGSPPWEVEAKLSILDIGGQYGGGGIFLRESATGKLVCFHMQNETPWMVHIRNFNSFNNSYNSDSKSTSEFGSLYYEFYAKINLTSTTLTYSFSPINNGVDFRTYVTTALTAFFTTAPDGIGIETVAYSQDSVTVCDYFRRTV